MLMPPMFYMRKFRILGESGLRLDDPELVKKFFDTNVSIGEFRKYVTQKAYEEGAKASPEEKQLLQLLFPEVKQSIQQRQKVRSLFNQVFSQMESSLPTVFQSLQSISQGYLPAPFRKALERQFQEMTGNILNKMAQRGILNSSVTQGALSSALGRIFDLQVQYLPTALEMAQAPLRTALDISSRLRSFERSFFLEPYMLYSLLRETRMKYRPPIIVDRGEGGFESILGQALGFVIGKALLGGLL